MYGRLVDGGGPYFDPGHVPIVCLGKRPNPSPRVPRGLPHQVESREKILRAGSLLKLPMTHESRLVALALAIGAAVLAAPLWLPLFGTALAVQDALEPGDVGLVLEGTGNEAIDTAEAWRQRGIVHDVVVVEAPVKTHALVAYWSDFVRWGLAEQPATPAEHLRVVRAPSTQAGQQAEAALPALQDLHSRAVLVVGGGGIGSRLVERELTAVLGPAGMSVRMVRSGGIAREPDHWYENAEDRRAVLDSWLQLIVPFLSGYDAGPGT